LTDFHKWLYLRYIFYFIGVGMSLEHFGSRETKEKIDTDWINESLANYDVSAEEFDLLIQEQKALSQQKDKEQRDVQNSFGPLLLAWNYQTQIEFVSIQAHDESDALRDSILW